jgi:transcriptional regulator with XRE-family HTH domain|tara:strand:+ start:1152 stop:1424 length:273 start_codon:yes stop_codon:yes gene_type:complete
MTNILYTKGIYMNFVELGKELALLRKSRGISQKTISSDLNISRATISNFENGTSSDIGLKKVLQLTDYLGQELVIKEKSLFPVFEDIVNG